MRTRTVDAVYRRGVVVPQSPLPFRDQAKLRLTLSFPANPVARTRGIIRISPQTARAIIYGEESDFYGA